MPSSTSLSIELLLRVLSDRPSADRTWEWRASVAVRPRPRGVGGAPGDPPGGACSARENRGEPRCHGAVPVDGAMADRVDGSTAAKQETMNSIPVN